MAYSLGTRCLAEFIGMIIVIYTGEAALANELLPSTKGHAMGWGWTVFTFGFAFFAPLQAFAKVSAKLNPAMCLAQWVWGNLTGVDFICLSLAELAGAFVGAVLHWIHYLPHYKTLPEPASTDKDDHLLRRRDTMKESALQIASYATRPDRKVTSNPLDPLKHTFYYFRQNDVIHEETPEEVIEEYFHTSDPLARRASKTEAAGKKPAVHPLARKTLQVADLQRHLRDAHVETVLRKRTCARCTSMGGGAAAADGNGHSCLRHTASSLPGDSFLCETPVSRPSPGAATAGAYHTPFGSAATAGAGATASPRAIGAGRAPYGSSSNDVKRVSDCEAQVPDAQMPMTPRAARQWEELYGSDEVTSQKQRAQALYEAAVVADQNAKLSIFATRPAIYSPLFNFITETMGTVALILLVLLIELQARRFPEDSDIKLFYEVGLQNLLICFTVVVLISGLGGPTAYAANPARDLGPRIAHAVLPIPGKGSSEWAYAWVPFFAPLLGGAIAGLLYIAIEEMQFPGGGSRGGGLFVG